MLKVHFGGKTPSSQDCFKNLCEDEGGGTEEINDHLTKSNCLQKVFIEQGPEGRC